MYENIGRWLAAMAVTLTISIIVIMTTTEYLTRISLGVSNYRVEGMVIGAIVASIISVLIGPLSQAIIKASGNRKGKG